MARLSVERGPVGHERYLKCAILGGGGHAAVVIDAMLAAGKELPVVVLDVDRRLWAGTLLGVLVRGGDDLLPQLLAEGISGFVVGLGGVGDNRPRQRLFELAVALGCQPVAVIHPAGVLSRWASLGAGSVLLAGAVVNARAQLGRNVIVNTGAIVEHDCVIEDHAHVATGACVASSVRIGQGAHIGAGATIRQGVTIGAAAIVAAGAVVVKDVLDGESVMGVPARVRSGSRASS
jgi:UDP-perosamine 4-acetyltransferase